MSRVRLTFLFISPLIKFCNEHDFVIQTYNVDKVTSNVNPLHWWAHNKNRFPWLAILANSLLSIMATSVLSERIFSTAGLIVNKLRNTSTGYLSPFLSRLLFLQKQNTP